MSWPVSKLLSGLSWSWCTDLVSPKLLILQPLNHPDMFYSSVPLAIDGIYPGRGCQCFPGTVQVGRTCQPCDDPGAASCLATDLSISTSWFVISMSSHSLSSLMHTPLQSHTDYGGEQAFELVAGHCTCPGAAFASVYQCIPCHDVNAATCTRDATLSWYTAPPNPFQ